MLSPAFHHGSEIEAFARAGLRSRFYEVDEGFGPDPEDLDQLVGGDVRALHLVHYIGFPQRSPFWRQWCDERGLLLIEDAAQAWLSEVGGRPVGAFGDVSVFCLYKTYGVPDGAALLTTTPPPSPRAGPLELGRIGRRHGSWLLQRSDALTRLRDHFGRPVPFSHTDDIALGEVDRGPSPVTARLVRRLGPEAAPQRRANYRRLARRLGDLAPAPFRAVPDRASPFVFPVDVDDKDGLMFRLRGRGVDALSFWTLPHPSLPSGYPRSEAARRRWVGLPVHQELSEGDLDRIIEAVLACL